MRNGRVDDAVAVGVEAMHEAREFHSHRMSAELKELARASRSRRSKDAVELSREIEAHTR